MYATLKLPQKSARVFPPPQPVRGVVGLAGCLGQPVPRAAPHDEVHGARQVYAVADRDVDRGDPGAGAHDLTDDLFAVDEVRCVSLLRAGLLVLADESALRAPD